MSVPSAASRRRVGTPRGRRLALAAATLAVLAATALVPAADAARKDRRDGRGLRQELDNPAEEAYKHFRFGLQYFQQGLLRQAESELRQALDVQGSYPEANYMLALVYLELNDFHPALREANLALQQNPFFTEAHNVLGLVHARMGNHDAALREFQVVLADINFPTPEVAHFNIGKLFWERSQCGDAVIHFRRALEVNAQFGRAWYLLGDCQEQLGERGQARESYGRAIDLMGDDVGPMYRLGYVCYQEGDQACARQWFDKVRALAPASDMAKAAREYVRAMEFR